MSRRKHRQDKSRKAPRQEISPIRMMRAGEMHHFNLRRLSEEGNLATKEDLDRLGRDYLSGKVPPPKPRDDADRARLMMYKAWALPIRSARVRAAKLALSACPDCADAYVLLAEEDAESPDEAESLFRKGLEAGARALGAEAIAKPEMDLWADVLARPYLRALLGLGFALDVLDRKSEAEEQFRELLRLNPNDNQGARESLLHMLVAAGRHAEAEALLDRYVKDDSAAWVYGRAFVRYHIEGKTPAVLALMGRALLANPFVPAVMEDDERDRLEPSEAVQPGGPTEAVAYAAEWKDVWEMESEFLDWALTELDRDNAFVKKFKRATNDLLRRDFGRTAAIDDDGEE